VPKSWGFPATTGYSSSNPFFFLSRVISPLSFSLSSVSLVIFSSRMVLH
jgi:hypothetical protein